MSDSFDPYQDWFGIPSESQPPNHYELLGVEMFESSIVKIESAVASRVEFLQSMSLGDHVDHAQRLLNDVARARICLTDSKKRNEYDSLLRNPAPENNQQSEPSDVIPVAKPLSVSQAVGSAVPVADATSEVRVSTDVASASSTESKSSKLEPRAETKSRMVLAVFVSLVTIAAIGAAIAMFGGGDSSDTVAKSKPIAVAEKDTSSATKAVSTADDEPASKTISETETAKPKANPETSTTKPSTDGGDDTNLNERSAEGTANNDSSVAETSAKPDSKDPTIENPTNAVKPTAAETEPPKRTNSKQPSAPPRPSPPTTEKLKVLSDANLVAYWPLDDGPVGSTVTRADDLIDNPNHGAKDAVANSKGDKWVFDEERNRVVLSTTEKNRLSAGTQDIDLEKGFSWALWAKIAKSNITDQGADVLIGTRQESDGNVSWHKFGTGGSSGWASIGGYQLADDRWHHIAYVGDKSGVSFYVDGALIGTNKSPKSSTYDGRLEIGGSSRFTEDVTALISEVAIWDKRLSTAEISDLANGGSVLLTGFRNFRTHFDPPERNKTTATKIGDIFLDLSRPPQAKMHFERSWSGSRADFQIRAKLKDQPSWIISQHDSGEADSADVARIWIESNAMMFRWLPAGETKTGADYLRNGVLEFSISDKQSHFMSLRSPVSLPPLKLSDEKFTAKLRSELNWLPGSKDLQIELLPLSLKDTNVHCTPKLVSRDPALMFFTKQESQANLWLELDGSVRQDKLSLESELKLNVQDRRGKFRAQTFEPKLLNNQIASMNQAINQSTQVATNIKDATKKKNAQAIIDQNKKTLASYESYSKLASSITNQNIGVRIYYEVNGHRVVVATTAMAKP